jgi:hypothetical protein
MIFRNLGVPELILMALCCGVPVLGGIVGVGVWLLTKSKNSDEL